MIILAFNVYFPSSCSTVCLQPQHCHTRARARTRAHAHTRARARTHTHTHTHTLAAVHSCPGLGISGYMTANTRT